MKLLIAAGGGGHFAPALAVIESLPKEDDVLVVGRKYSFEADKTIALEFQTAQRLGISYKSITTGRLQRTITRHTIPSLLKLPLGFYQAIRILKKFQPDIVLSFGGYISVPVVYAAHFLRIPVVIHEQTVDAGMANKLAVRFASKICISWESSQKFFPKSKTTLTGNPLRKAILSQLQNVHKKSFEEIISISDEKLPLIYVTGGSSGSHEINGFIGGCLEKLLSTYRVVHQTGNAQQFKDFERLAGLKKSFDKKLQKRYSITKFLSPEEVGAVLQKADLVISRCGMSTMTELLYMGKPCLLIPLPMSAHGEQLKNARFLEKVGIAEVLNEEQTSSELLHEQINHMIETLPTYKKAGTHSTQLVETNAAAHIIQILKDLTSQK